MSPPRETHWPFSVNRSTTQPAKGARIVCLPGGHRGGRLGDLLLPRPGLGQGESRLAASELGLDRLKLCLGVLKLVDCARAPLGEPGEAGQPALGVGHPGLETSDQGPGLIDFFRPGARLELGELLPPPLEFGRGPPPLDLKQPPQQPGDRLAVGHVLAIHDGKIDQPAVDRAADVAGSRGDHRTDKRLPGGQFHRGHPSGHHRYRPRLLPGGLHHGGGEDRRGEKGPKKRGRTFGEVHPYHYIVPDAGPEEMPAA